MTAQWPQWLSPLEQHIDHSLTWSPAMHQHLHQAMRYSALSPGKRLRGLLVLASGLRAGAELAACLNVATAVELVHAYSLIHDDLPVMDNDDLRRGQPTCHKVFGEAFALLAGDALQSEAFALLSQPLPGLEAQRQLQLLACFASALGAQGMAAGQARDLAASGQELSLDELIQLEQQKTGALFAASLKMGGYLGQASAAELVLLEAYGLALGLAFQIQDDCLDVSADATTLGKTPGKDERDSKATFARLLGLSAARQLMAETYAEAWQLLGQLKGHDTELGAIQRHMQQRQH